MKKAKRISMRENGLGSVRIFLVRMFSLIAIGIAVYLAIASWLGGGIAGCGGEGIISCDHVVSSKWSRWLEIPVGFLAMAAYLVIFILTWFVSKKSRRIVHSASWSMVIVMAVSCLGAAVWFVGLQVVAIQSFCVYCMISHACGVIVAILLLSGIPVAHQGQDPRWLATMQQTASGSHRQKVRDQPALHAGIKMQHLATAVTVGLFAVMLLIVGQILFPHQTMLVEKEIVHHQGLQNQKEDVSGESVKKEYLRKIPTEPEHTRVPTENGLELAKLPSEEDLKVEVVSKERIVTLAKDIQVDVYAEPRLGHPESDFVIAEVFDYTCPACRVMHGFLGQCKKRYGNQLVIVMLPSPYHSKCNQHVEKDTAMHHNACEYARLALAVWRLNPQFFPEVHDWLMASKKPPSLLSAMEYVKKRIDAESLQKELAKMEIKQRIEQNIICWEKAGNKLPALVLETAALTGLPNNQAQLFKVLEEQIGIMPAK